MVRTVSEPTANMEVNLEFADGSVVKDVHLESLRKSVVKAWDHAVLLTQLKVTCPCFPLCRQPCHTMVCMPFIMQVYLFGFGVCMR